MNKLFSIGKRLLPYLLASLSSLLIYLTGVWYFSTIGFVIALVPLLFAVDLITNDGRNAVLFRIAILGFVFYFLQDIIFTHSLSIMFHGWVLLFFFCNSLLFCLFFTFFGLIKKRLGDKWGYVAFVATFVSFEYLILNIDFSFPAIILGFSFIGLNNSGLPFIQWYDITGELGGSLWILISNVLLYILIRNRIERKNLNKRLLVGVVSVIILPAAFSLFRFFTYVEHKDPVEFVLVQPNYDPYTEKFEVPINDQLDRMLNLAESKITQKTDIIAFPETALDSNFWCNNINNNGMVNYIYDNYLAKYPNANIITGAKVLQYFIDDNAPSTDAVQVNDSIFIQLYNADILIKSDRDVQVYKKNKLVLNTERIPLLAYFPFLAKLGDNDFNGTPINMAKGGDIEIMKTTKASIGTPICYESMFGEYCAKFANIGAEILCIVCNDGWWNGSDIPLKHLRLAQLRAIESRRSIARCGNTGITAGIDQCGRIVAQLPWWEQNAMNITLNKNKTKTLYSMVGDYIGIMAAIVCFFVFWVFIIKVIIKK